MAAKKGKTGDSSDLDNVSRTRVLAATVAAWPANAEAPLRCPIDANHPPVVVVLDEGRRVGFLCPACEFRLTAGELAHALHWTPRTSPKPDY